MRIQFEISESKAFLILEILKNFSTVKNIERLDDFVLTDEYKKEIDNWLEKRERGEINFISEDEFFKQLDEV